MLDDGREDVKINNVDEVKTLSETQEGNIDNSDQYKGKRYQRQLVSLMKTIAIGYVFGLVIAFALVMILGGGHMDFQALGGITVIAGGIVSAFMLSKAGINNALVDYLLKVAGNLFKGLLAGGFGFGLVMVLFIFKMIVCGLIAFAILLFIALLLPTTIIYTLIMFILERCGLEISDETGKKLDYIVPLITVVLTIFLLTKMFENDRKGVPDASSAKHVSTETQDKVYDSDNVYKSVDSGNSSANTNSNPETNANTNTDAETNAANSGLHAVLDARPEQDTSEEKLEADPVTENAEGDEKAESDTIPVSDDYIEAYRKYFDDLNAQMVADYGEDAWEYAMYWIAYLDDDDIPEIIYNADDGIDAYMYDDGEVKIAFALDWDDVYYIPGGNNIITLGGSGEDSWIDRISRSEDGTYGRITTMYSFEQYKAYSEEYDRIMREMPDDFVHLNDQKSYTTVQELCDALKAQ